jgi:hypothetical protein
MKNEKLKAIVSGFAGALTLTGVHQGLKSILTDAPEMDRLGMRGIKKFLDNLNIQKPSSRVLYYLSLAGDLIFNTFYYSLTAAGKKPLITGSLLGIGAGTGVVSLPSSMGLGSDLSSKNVKQAALSLGVYLSGGLTAAGVYKLFQKYSR